MPKLNENYLNVQDSYLFAEIARRVKVYEETHPDKAQNIIRLGIGDVTRPLTKSAIEALHEAVDMQAVPETFKGYGPEQGYEFARQAVAGYYAKNGVHVDADDVFISDGAKSDTGNITELFAQDNVILVPDPVYPVYVDTNTMDGKQILYMNGTEENNFLPMPDDSVKADIIYLCSPNNPTGACYNKEQLKAWVEYALKNEAVILFDSAYEAFVSEPELPRSIYAVEGAEKCAIEFCSLSKTVNATLSSGGLPTATTLNLVIGNVAGPMGACCILAVAACGLLLLCRGHLKLSTFLPYLIVCVLVPWLLPNLNDLPSFSFPWEYVRQRVYLEKYIILSGTMLFGGIFLASEPVTQPNRHSSRIIYGLALGAFATAMRYFADYETGFCFALLLVNAIPEWLDRLARRTERMRFMRREEKRLAQHRPE